MVSLLVVSSDFFRSSTFLICEKAGQSARLPATIRSNDFKWVHIGLKLEINMKIIKAAKVIQNIIRSVETARQQKALRGWRRAFWGISVERLYTGANKGHFLRI